MFSTLLIPFDVEASCDYQTKADLMKMASNVQINSSYELVNNYPVFYVELSNVTPEIYVKDNLGNTITYDSNKVLEAVNGSSFNYTIYSGHPSCFGEKLNTKYVNLQTYNKFYGTDDCKQNPDFGYCKLWYDADFTVEYFRELLSEYKNKKNVSQIEQSNESGNYLVYILAGGCLTILTIIIIVVRRKKYGW